MDGSGGRWTEERHSRFLNWIESTFVHQMLGLHSDAGRFLRCAARLDRRVPDSVTDCDSGKYSQMRSPPAPAANPGRRHDTCNCTRKQSLRRHNASLDQVVPEFKNKGDGEDALKGK